jgi:hypothetical protein
LLHIVFSFQYSPSGAAAENANVKALVYVAAFAPEPGEVITVFGEKYLI